MAPKDFKASNKKTAKDYSRFYKNKYGSVQEGHRLPYEQKSRIIQKYTKQKQKLENAGNRESGLQLATEAEWDDFNSVFGVKKEKVKTSKLKKAQEQFHNKRNEKQEAKKSKDAKQKEIVDKQNRFKEKRLERYKKLNQKTKSGQPVMKGRIELLLASIQKGKNEGGS